MFGEAFAHKRMKPPYTCLVCEKIFTKRFNYNRHILIHTGDKPFSCAYCDMRFNDKGHCIRHERLHLGLTKSRRDKLFACKFCDQTFVNKEDCKEHEASHAALVQDILKKVNSNQVSDKKLDESSNVNNDILTHENMESDTFSGQTVNSLPTIEDPQRENNFSTDENIPVLIKQEMDVDDAGAQVDETVELPVPEPDSSDVDPATAFLDLNVHFSQGKFFVHFHAIFIQMGNVAHEIDDVVNSPLKSIDHHRISMHIFQNVLYNLSDQILSLVEKCQKGG